MTLTARNRLQDRTALLSLHLTNDRKMSRRDFVKTAVTFAMGIPSFLIIPLSSYSPRRYQAAELDIVSTMGIQHFYGKGPRPVILGWFAGRT
jgi:hypothetical protein